MAEDRNDGAPNAWDDADVTIDSFLRDVARAPNRAASESEAPDPQDAVLREGALVAERFRLVRCLGEGGMGVVWSARHVVTQKAVALKFLKATARDRGDVRERFVREARAACAVNHPNIVEIHDVIEREDGSPVLVMDLLEGESLAAKLAREGALTVSEVARILVPVCAAVGSAHALGIVHRGSQTR